MEENKLNIPKATTGDLIHTGAKIGLSLIPAAGEIFNSLIKSPLEKRKEELTTSIINKLKELESQSLKFSIEELQKNDLFVSVCMTASQAALKEHQEEKINALKNTIINSVAIEDIEDQSKLLYLNILESLTVVHILILKFFKNAGGSHYMSFADRFDIFKKHNPKCDVSKEMFVSICEEMESRGLVKRNKNFNMQDGTFESYVNGHSHLGNEVLKFISGHF